MGADQTPDLLLSERVWVIRAQHDAILAHDADEEGERFVAEYRGIDVDAVEVGGWQSRAILAHDVTIAPGIVDAPDEIREAAAAVREAQLERARQPLECSRENQPEYRQ